MNDVQATPGNISRKISHCIYNTSVICNVIIRIGIILNRCNSREKIKFSTKNYDFMTGNRIIRCAGKSKELMAAINVNWKLVEVYKNVCNLR